MAPEAPAKPLSRTARRAAAEDAKLLAAIRVLLSNPSVFPRVIFLAFGFAAITSLGIAYTEAIALPSGLRYAVVPRPRGPARAAGTAVAAGTAAAAGPAGAAEDVGAAPARGPVVGPPAW